MIVNRVRGLYRFCWLIAVLLSASTVISFYDRTTEPSGYAPRIVDSPPADWRGMRAINLPEVGILFIPRWVPPDPEMELKLAEDCRDLSEGGPATFVVSEVRSVNWVKMFGLVLCVSLTSALATRGTAGALIWVVRALSPDYS